MQSKTKKKLFTFVIATLFISLLLGSSYYFANIKNKPVYQSEIDKIMFDTKNKPPKYLLTLPSKKRIKAVEAKIMLTEEEHKSALGAFEVIQKIPNLARIAKIKNKKPLEVIEKINDAPKPWIDYAKNVSVPQNFYKVAVVIKNFGLSDKNFENLLSVLPSNVSISFSPYAKNIEKKVQTARENGHETYVDMLLSPDDVLKIDNGPLALSITSSVEQNINKIRTIYQKDMAIGGFLTSVGMADEQSAKRLSKILEFLESQSLLFIDGSGDVAFDKIKTSSLAREKADIVIHNNFSKKYIKEKLLEAEVFALKNGAALIVIEPKPITIIELLNWINSFSVPDEKTEKGYYNPKKPFVLVPLSEIVVE